MTGNSEKLFRSSLFYFHPVESGGAGLYPLAPFGGLKPVLDRVADILGLEKKQDDESLKFRAKIYLQYLLDLPDIIKSCDLPCGTYKVVNLEYAFAEMTQDLDQENSEDVAEAERRAAPAYENSFKDYQIEVEVTPTLLAMAKSGIFHIEIGYNVIRMPDQELLEKGAEWMLENYRQISQMPPGQLYENPICVVDGKRPYGDKTYYYWDLEDLKIPGLQADEAPEISGERQQFSSSAQAKIDELHQKIPSILQAMAAYGEIRTT